MSEAYDVEAVRAALDEANVDRADSCACHVAPPCWACSTGWRVTIDEIAKEHGAPVADVEDLAGMFF